MPPGGELVPSVSKYEHHITETVNGPIVYHQENIHMPSYHQNPQPQITPNSEPKQPRNGQSVSNHFSDVIPQLESQQKRFPNQNFLDVDVRSNNRQNSDEGRHSTPAQVISSTYRPTTVPARKEPVRSTTVAPISSTKKPSTYQLPDEVPDDLRQQLLSSGILDNADISVLDYDKLGETSLENLPPEHLANFFSAGGGTQIGASNKIVSVLKPNGDSINDKIKSLKSDTNIMKILDSTKKQPSKKEDINLKVVRFDSDSQKSVSNQYIKPDSAVLPSVDINQQIYNRYLPLKINGAQFPIPEELRGRKISSVVVLAPVDNLLSGDQATDDDGRYERDILDSRHVKFIAGDSLKQLLAKPTSENYKRWLEKEGKTETDLQSVVLLVTK